MSKRDPKPSTGMGALEEAALELRERLDHAAGVIAAYEETIAPIRARFAVRMRRSAADIRAARELVEEVVRGNPGLFKSPKTLILHGIKAGLRKGADRWAWPDERALVDLIRALCTPAQQEAYLITTTVGRKDAIPAEARHLLGIGFTAGTDQVVVEEQSANTAAALLALLAALPPDEEEAPEGAAGGPSPPAPPAPAESGKPRRRSHA